MKPLPFIEALSEMCKATRKWGMYISINNVDEFNFLEQVKAAPCISRNTSEGMQILVDRGGFFLFDTEEEMEENFWMTVGDDGPTVSNPYNGSVKVYAITCAPDGEFITENT